MELRQTFELYFDEGEATRKFEPLTCRATELLAAVEEIRATRGLKSIEVRQSGQTLFTLE